MLISYLESITSYKKKVMETLWNSQDILTQIFNTNEVPYQKFKQHVVPYRRHPDTITEKGVYIMFEVDPIKLISSTAMRYVIQFWVMCSNDINVTSQGVKVDLLSRNIDQLLNGNTNFGIGSLECKGALSFSTSYGFSGREIKYETPDFNQRR